MSDYSEDDVRRAADIREWLIKQISDKQEEIERLRTTLFLIDILLKQGSFKSASSLEYSHNLSSSSAPSTPHPSSSTTSQMPAEYHILDSSKQQRDADTTITGDSSTINAAPENKQQQQNAETDFRETRQLKRVKDNLLLANVALSSTSIEINLVEGINLNSNTPPFKSFFLNRILEGMRTKDAEKIAHGHMKESESLNYRVEEDNNGFIKRIIINNYREKERLNEIFNTSTWVLTRMVEKTGR